MNKGDEHQNLADYAHMTIPYYRQDSLFFSHFANLQITLETKQE